MFQFIEQQGFYAPDHRDLDLLSTNLNMNRDHMSFMANLDTNYDVPKLNRFQVMERTRIFLFQVTVTLTFGLLTPKSIGIINGSWQTRTQYMVFLSLIGF